MPNTAYGKFKLQNPFGPTSFGLKNRSNLPTYTSSGSLQRKSSTVGDMFDELQRVAGLQYQGMISQGQTQTGRDLSRLGLQFSSPKWRESLMNPVHKRASEFLAGRSADIGQLKSQHELAWERMRLMEIQIKMQGKKTGLGKILGTLGGVGLGALFAPATGGMSLAAAMGMGGFLGGTAGSGVDYLTY